jgi:hypothetical protein
LLTLSNRHWFPSTTILSAAQRPRLHIGCYPFAHDFENTSDSQWYNCNTIVRASSSYALLSGAYVLMPSVGYTFVLDPKAWVVGQLVDVGDMGCSVALLALSLVLKTKANTMTDSLMISMTASIRLAPTW